MINGKMAASSARKNEVAGAYFLSTAHIPCREKPMVTIESLDYTDGSWKVVKSLPNTELPPKTTKLFWLFTITERQFEPTSEVVKRAVQEARTMGGIVRVVNRRVLDDTFCVFWENGRWLHPASHA